MRALILCLLLVSACSADVLDVDTCTDLAQYDTCGGTWVCVVGECQPTCKVDLDCPEVCCLVTEDDPEVSACAPKEYCK